MDDLRTFPAAIRAWIASSSEVDIRTRASDGTFALVEQVWHLADLEAEGYGVRLARILDEDDPVLPDFHGDLIAEERHYLDLELEPALERFTSARAANLERLASLTEQQWQRGGQQEGVGRVTVARIVEMMREHDAGHAREVRALLGRV
jgi:hypothetical protein